MRVSEASLTKLSYKIFHLFSYIQELPGGKKIIKVQSQFGHK